MTRINPKSNQKSMVTKMSRIIFSFFFALSLCLTGFAFAQLDRSGTLYFPIAWEISAQDTINPAQFSSSTLTFQNTKTGAKFTQAFDSKAINSGNGKQGVVFFAKKITTLSAGQYNQVSFATKYQKGQQAVDLVASYPVNYDVANDKVTVMGGVYVQSAFNAAATGLMTPKIVKLNQFAMGYDKLVNDLKAEKISADSAKLSDSINFSNTSSPQIVREFPAQDPTARSSTSLAHYGAVINMPCAFSGVSGVVLKRENDSVLYLKSIPVSHQNCPKAKGEYPNPMHVFLNAGKWSINQVMQASFDNLTALGFDVVNRQDVLDYYQMNKMDFLKYNAISQVPSMNFSFTVQSDMFSKSFLYMGAFEWQTDAKNQSNVFFVRKFFLSDLRKLFGFEQIFNGYTGARMAHHKVLGSISVFFRDVNVAKANKTEVTNFEKASLQSITTCLQKTYQVDPLFSLDGQILFYNNPKDLKHMQSEIKFPQASDASSAVQTCLAAALKNLPIINNEFSINAEISSL
jgi:hypothetical protein